MNEVAYDVFYTYPKLPPNKYWGELINDAKNLCLDNFGAHPPTKVLTILYTIQILLMDLFMPES